MQTLSSLLPKIDHPVSEEEYEAAKKRLERANSPCDPDCPTCHGSGYVRTGYGKVEVCPGLFQKYARQHPEKYGLTEGELLELDWDALKPVNSAPKAGEEIRSILEKGYGMVFLWGDYGQAKTLLLKIVTAVMLRSGKEAAYANMSEILDNLREAYDAANPNDEAVRRLERWQNLPVLCIDEFNRVSETPWVAQRRSDLVNARYVQAVRQESLTLIASNDPPEKQEGSIADRLQDSRLTIIKLTGTSARKAMRKEYKW